MKEKEEDKEEISGIQISKEFAIIDGNNHVHIIKGDTFEHVSVEYTPVQ